MIIQFFLTSEKITKPTRFGRLEVILKENRQTNIAEKLVIILDNLTDTASFRSQKNYKNNLAGISFES